MIAKLSLSESKREFLHNIFEYYRASIHLVCRNVLAYAACVCGPVSIRYRLN